MEKNLNDNNRLDISNTRLGGVSVKKQNTMRNNHNRNTTRVLSLTNKMQRRAININFNERMRHEQNLFYNSSFS